MLITCRKIDSLLADYLEGALAAYLRPVFRLHMAFCAPCRKYLDGYRKTADLAHQSCAGQDPMPEDLIQSILAAQKIKP